MPDQQGDYLPYYHASELESLKGIYFDKGWTQLDKVRFQKSLISCFAVAQPFWGLSCGMTFDEFSNNEDLRELIQTPYALCALWCTLSVLDRAREQDWSEPIQFVFDKGDDGAGELAELWTLLRKGEPLLAPLRFGNTKEFLGLQAADFHSYESWKHLKDQHLQGKPFDLEHVRKSLRAAFVACDEMECSVLANGTYQPLIDEIRRVKALRRRR